MMYDERFIGPMRQELTRIGFEELRRQAKELLHEHAADALDGAAGGEAIDPTVMNARLARAGAGEYPSMGWNPQSRRAGAVRSIPALAPGRGGVNSRLAARQRRRGSCPRSGV